MRLFAHVFSCNVMRSHKSFSMTWQATKGNILNHYAALSFILYKIKPLYRFTSRAAAQRFYSPAKLLSEAEHLFGDKEKSLKQSDSLYNRLKHHNEPIKKRQACRKLRYKKAPDLSIVGRCALRDEPAHQQERSTWRARSSRCSPAIVNIKGKSSSGHARSEMRWKQQY